MTSVFRAILIVSIDIKAVCEAANKFKLDLGITTSKVFFFNKSNYIKFFRKSQNQKPSIFKA